MRDHRVLIDDGYDYDGCCVCQQCEACGWTTRRGRREIETCPECGQPVEPAEGVRLGKTVVSYSGWNADLYVADAGPFASGITLQAADLVDILKFLARHVAPDRGRGLPNIHAIRGQIWQALSQLPENQPTEARRILVGLLEELDPRRAAGEAKS